MSLMLGTLKLYDSNKIAIAYITEDMFKKTETSLEDTDQFVNMCLDIQGVEVAALIKYQDEHYQKVNLRSCNHYDVSKLANKFGGGGHKRAAGYKSTLPIKELVNVMVREIKKGMQMI
jgi:phosphoesterase RecJ-like protein